MANPVRMRARDRLLGRLWASPTRVSVLRRRRAVRVLPVAGRPAVALAPPQPPARLRRELDALPQAARLAASGSLAVYLLRPGQAPAVLQELGRLRELTFRAVGEGRGTERDLDRFDRLYTHLVVWDEATGVLVGAYRLGFTDELPGGGSSCLYTATLFHLAPRFLEAVRPAVELGRSFVRPEYQRGFAPLALLWRGIGAVIAARPQYRYLFGPVTISRRYDVASRAMMVRFLQQPGRRHALASAVRPRHPFRPGPGARALGRLADRMDDVEALSRLIAAGEPDGAGVPILLRQYLKLGARSLAFSVDPQFSGCLDALCLVDLMAVSERTLRRYMGAEAACSYQAAQRLRSA